MAITSKQPTSTASAPPASQATGQVNLAEVTQQIQTLSSEVGKFAGIMQSQVEQTNKMAVIIGDQQTTIEQLRQQIQQAKPSESPAQDQSAQSGQSTKPDVNIMADTIQKQTEELKQKDERIKSLESTLDEIRQEYADRPLTSRLTGQEKVTFGLGILMLFLLPTAWHLLKTRKMKERYRDLLFSERIELEIPGQKPHIYIPEKSCQTVAGGQLECWYATLHVTGEGTRHEVNNMTDLKDSVCRTLKSYNNGGFVPPASKRLIAKARSQDRLGELRA